MHLKRRRSSSSKGRRREEEEEEVEGEGGMKSKSKGMREEEEEEEGEPEKEGVSGITPSTRHARDDIPAMIEKIHKIKTSEFRLYQPNVEEVVHEEQPYKLYVIYELWKAMLL
ncbi:BnaA08g20780D [Brassica napus]|uniref:BnaA08g20780D protein n=1 Tax=Brassica napus TaxID=3708 RepID=A0A078HUS0_BRANA|nr:BnaA08g20780D [Brassica napus]